MNPRSSWRASKEFRLQLIEELARRGLKKAILLAGGDANCNPFAPMLPEE